MRLVDPIKDLIGIIWSALISKQLNSQPNRDTIEELLTKCDRHPGLLRRVTATLTVSTKYGFKINCDRCDYIGRKVITEGIWEPLIAATIASLVRPGDICIDIGANIGFDTLIMSTSAGPTGTIMSFEPDWSNIKSLLNNLQINSVSNVQVLSLGLGDKCVTGLLDTTGERGRSHLRPDINMSEQTGPLRQAITILPLGLLFNIDTPKQIRLIKLDIEGFEYKALIGAHSLLNRVDAVLCEIDPYFLKECGGTPNDIFSLMRAEGFKSYCAEPESTEMWIEGNESFVYEKSFKSGHKPFDALFLRTEAIDIETLQKNGLISF